MTAVVHSRDPVGDTVTAPVTAARRRRIPDVIWSLAIAVALLGLAELSAAREWVSPLLVPSPSDVWTALRDGFSSGVFWEHIWSTLRGTLFGFAGATAVSLAVAGVLASSPRLERILLPFIVAFQTVPKVAIAPLIVLWLGFEDQSKMVIVGIVAFFPILVNSLSGLKIRERDRFEVLDSLGASRWQLFRYLRLPSALPYIFAGLHVGIIFSLIGAVVAEFVGSRDGLGYYLMQQKAAFNAPGVYSALVLLTVIGLLLNAAMRLLERKLAFWAADVTSTSA